MSFFSLPKRDDLFSPFFISPELRDDLGKLIEEALGEIPFLELLPLKINLASMASRFLDCGARLCAAYGSFKSPAGVNGLVYVDEAITFLFGLDSREAAAELGPSVNRDERIDPVPSFILDGLEFG